MEDGIFESIILKAIKYENDKRDRRIIDHDLYEKWGK